MIYLHIPYCHRKCTYCAFYSTVTAVGRQEYVDALCRELVSRRHCMQHPIRTVYFGGGTPTILTITQLEQIVATIKDNYDCSALEEVTIEANPEDLTRDYLQGLREVGFFNRLSIGVQSFDDTDLRLLNRRHVANQSIEAVCNAREFGFDNISVDLIYGLPNQTLEGWQKNLLQLEHLEVSHLSAYALTVEEGTMLKRQIEEGRVSMADEDMVVNQYQLLVEWGSAHGFVQYEVSNFSRPGFYSRHNSRYWNRTPYLGIGAAAHSFDGSFRRWNVADVGRYIKSTCAGPIEHEEEELTLKDAHNEYLMTALRTIEGVDKRLVAGPFAPRLHNDMQKYVAAGLIEETPTHFRPTREGLLHADGMAADLFV